MTGIISQTSDSICLTVAFLKPNAMTNSQRGHEKFLKWELDENLTGKHGRHSVRHLMRNKTTKKKIIIMFLIPLYFDILS